jgi:hypothetical protein
MSMQRAHLCNSRYPVNLNSLVIGTGRVTRGRSQCDGRFGQGALAWRRLRAGRCLAWIGAPISVVIGEDSRIQAFASASSWLLAPIARLQRVWVAPGTGTGEGLNWLSRPHLHDPRQTREQFRAAMHFIILSCQLIRQDT